MLPDTVIEISIYRNPEDHNAWYYRKVWKKDGVLHSDTFRAYSIQMSGAYENEHGCPILISEKQMIFENND